MSKSIQAGKFKAHCLQIMSDVSKTKVPILVTKHSQPFVKIVPIEKNKKSLFGCLKGTIHFHGDITSPLEEKWDADC